MSTHILPLDCDGFAAWLADYLEGESSEGARAQMTAHAATCDACGSLLADLDAIRTDAAALPVLEPSRDLWAGIAERIDATVVVPMDVPRVARLARRPWLRPAAAAAALVIVTAGVTHLLTRATLSSPAVPSTQVAVATPNGTASEPLPAATNGEFSSTLTEAPSVQPSDRSSVRSSDRPTVEPSNRQTVRPILVAEQIMKKDAQPVYDREIGKLREIVKERRSELDPATIAVLEQSIAVIDSAIAQSRAALAKDPASGFLATQLNHSLEKKVELLRTAALLPART